MKLTRALALILSAALVLMGTPVTCSGLAQDPPQQQAPTTPAATTPPQDPPPPVVDNTKDAAAEKNAKAKKSKGKKDDVDEIGNRDVGKGMNWYSLEKEIQLGKALAQQVEAQSRLVNDPVISEYVNRVGQNLVRNSDAKVPFTIKVIDDDTVNAFALPGGFFFVQTGVIMEADEEAELAGVMAHEIAHVAARHGTRGQTSAQFARLRIGSRSPGTGIYVQGRLRSASLRDLLRKDPGQGKTQARNAIEDVRVTSANARPD